MASRRLSLSEHAVISIAFRPTKSQPLTVSCNDRFSNNATKLRSAACCSDGLDGSVDPSSREDSQVPRSQLSRLKAELREKLPHIAQEKAAGRACSRFWHYRFSKDGPAETTYTIGYRGEFRNNQLETLMDHSELQKVLDLPTPPAGSKLAPFVARLVVAGDSYGPQGQRTLAEDEQPQVELFDKRARGNPQFHELGQFVGNYYLSTLAEGLEEGIGLDVHGGVPSWSLTPEATETLTKWARAHCEQLDVEYEPREAATASRRFRP
ncbi:MAG: hypothetical protein JWN04_4470 [Myxococcaceae bacterium]|nr:hypothetical protein [Myxococcaceae bacterium]